MIVIAKSRLLPRTEVSSLTPIAQHIVSHARNSDVELSKSDPLRIWFKPKSAAIVRSLERSICQLLVDQTSAWTIDDLSGFAATFYTALFSSYRSFALTFRGSNPTWFKPPKDVADRLQIPGEEIERRFLSAVEDIAKLNLSRGRSRFEGVSGEIRMADATTTVPRLSVDCILTSPPYCTRIDYTAATRIELAVLSQLVSLDTDELNRSMIGTTKVPNRVVNKCEGWGDTCEKFLESVRNHDSKASSGYYYQTHLDYFDKMSRSVGRMSAALRTEGLAIVIVQDSYYKDVHNDLPGIVTEMAAENSLILSRRENFPSRNCMSRINPKAQSRSARSGATESVLFFRKTISNTVPKVDV
jgi:hypothetical protein